jgi:hypothetical protein
MESRVSNELRRYNWTVALKLGLKALRLERGLTIGVTGVTIGVTQTDLIWDVGALSLYVTLKLQDNLTFRR